MANEINSVSGISIAVIKNSNKQFSCITLILHLK